MTQQTLYRIGFWLWFFCVAIDALGVALDVDFVQPSLLRTLGQGAMALFALYGGWPTEADGPRT